MLDRLVQSARVGDRAETEATATAAAAIQPRAAALLNLRVPPGTDPHHAGHLLVAHLTNHAPWGAHVDAVVESVGEPFAAETTGMLDKVHGTMFNAIHNERALPPNAGNDEILAYLGKKGVDTKTLGDAMNSFAMTARLAQALQFAQRSGIEGTPTLVVNGKYRVIGGRSLEDILRITDHLVAMERAAQ